MVAKKKKFKKNKKVIEKSRRLSYFTLPEEIKRWIWAIMMFLVAMIVALAFFNLAGAAGRVFMGSFTFLIGKAVFGIPLLFVLGGLVFFRQRYKPSTKKFGGGLVILAILILILGIAGIFGSLTPENKQGGWVGYLISWPILKTFGMVASRIIFGAVIIIGGLILGHFLYQPKIKIEGKKLFSSSESKPSFIKKVFSPKFKVKEVEPSASIERAQAALSEIKERPPSLNQQNFAGLELKTKPVENKDRAVSRYQFPPTNLLEVDRGVPTTGDIRINSAIIKRTLQNFDIQVEMSEVNIGPTVTQYTLKPAEGVKLSKITGLSNDLALALSAHPLRIEAPIPGRPLVGIEVPNRIRTLARFRNLIEHPNFQNSTSNLTFVLGRDVAGNPLFADLARMPHLLVAGSTGTGKTICLNSIILSLLYKNSPETLRFILIDPKRVEFPVYNELPHLLAPVIFDAQKTVNVLKWLIGEMERRFEVFSSEKARDITNYNETMLRDGLDVMPYIVLIVDELADLMAARGREVEAGIVRLAQMARAVGIHLVMATQRPSVEVITGLIKANITSRITFQVASQVDSRTVLDAAGAEKLLGLGDMLFISAEVVKPRRIQGTYISEKEVKKVVDFVKSKVKSMPRTETEFLARGQKSKVEPVLTETTVDKEEITEFSPAGDLSESLEKTLEEGKEFDFLAGEEDPLYEEAKKVIIEARKASASLLQRRLRIGYARAARLIDILEERGVVGPGEGAKPREVYIEENSKS